MPRARPDGLPTPFAMRSAMLRVQVRSFAQPATWRHRNSTPVSGSRHACEISFSRVGQRKRIEPSGPRHGLFSQTSACVWPSAEAKMNELRVAPRLCAHPSTSTKTESWMNQWIDALTLPPPSGTSVLATVYSPKRGKSFLCVAALVDVGVGELWGLKRGRDLDLNAPEDFVLSGDCEVTHWMPLPELPKRSET